MRDVEKSRPTCCPSGLDLLSQLSVQATQIPICSSGGQASSHLRALQPAVPPPGMPLPQTCPSHWSPFSEGPSQGKQPMALCMASPSFTSFTALPRARDCVFYLLISCPRFQKGGSFLPLLHIQRHSKHPAPRSRSVHSAAFPLCSCSSALFFSMKCIPSNIYNWLIYYIYHLGSLTTMSVPKGQGSCFFIVSRMLKMVQGT